MEGVKEWGGGIISIFLACNSLLPNHTEMLATQVKCNLGGAVLPTWDYPAYKARKQGALFLTKLMVIKSIWLDSRLSLNLPFLQTSRWVISKSLQQEYWVEKKQLECVLF